MLSRLKLFVGSSDVQVPLETIFDAMPGDIFALRNAGNTCTHATWPEGPPLHMKGPLSCGKPFDCMAIHPHSGRTKLRYLYIIYIYIYNIHPIYKICPFAKMGLLSLPSQHPNTHAVVKNSCGIWGRRQHDGQRWVLSLVTRKDLCFPQWDWQENLFLPGCSFGWGWELEAREGWAAFYCLYFVRWKGSLVWWSSKRYRDRFSWNGGTFCLLCSLVILCGLHGHVCKCVTIALWHTHTQRNAHFWAGVKHTNHPNLTVLHNTVRSKWMIAMVRQY